MNNVNGALSPGTISCEGQQVRTACDGRDYLQMNNVNGALSPGTISCEGQQVRTAFDGKGTFASDG